MLSYTSFVPKRKISSVLGFHHFQFISKSGCEVNATGEPIPHIREIAYS